MGRVEEEPEIERASSTQIWQGLSGARLLELSLTHFQLRTARRTRPADELRNFLQKFKACSSANVISKAASACVGSWWFEKILREMSIIEAWSWALSFNAYTSFNGFSVVFFRGGDLKEMAVFKEAISFCLRSYLCFGPISRKMSIFNVRYWLR